MSFGYGSSSGVLITGSPQTIVTAPASLEERAVRSIRVTNRKTTGVNVEIGIWYREGANDREIAVRNVAPGGQILLTPDEVLILDATNESIVGKIMSGTYSADFVASWGELV